MFIKQKRAQSSYNLFILNVYLWPIFLKTYLTKTAGISVKKRQMACLFIPEKLQKLY